eukprot:scaffold20.g7611.t1
MAAPETQPEASSSGSLKDQGNEAFRSGNYLSNRSVALLHLSKTTKALADADECIRLRPDWAKGHFRKATVLEVLGRVDEALAAYQTAAHHSPEDRAVAEKVRNLARKAARAANGATASGGR